MFRNCFFFFGGGNSCENRFGLLLCVVLSYQPSTTAKEYVSELVSMAEATLNWMRTFDDDVDDVSFTTERRTILVINCGPGDVWLACAFDKKKAELLDLEDLKKVMRIAIENTSTTKGSSNAGGFGDEDSEKKKKLNASKFQNLSAVALRYLRRKLKLETFTSHGLHDVLDGLPVLSIGRQSFLLIRFLQNALKEALATTDTPVAHTMFMYTNFILWSSLSPCLTEQLYHKYVDHMSELNLLQGQSPGFSSDKTLSSAFNLKINLNFDNFGTSSGNDGSKALSPDGFVTQLDLVARKELTQAFSFRSDDNEEDDGEDEEEERRSVFIFIYGSIAVAFLTRGLCSLNTEIRKRLSDLLKRSCVKIGESIRVDQEMIDEPKTSNFDAACVDEASCTTRTMQPSLERPESLKLRLDLASQLKREFSLGGGNRNRDDCKSTSELMVHSHNSIWASLQRSGLKKYYMLSEENTLIGAHIGMRKNAGNIFDTCIP